MVAARHNQDRRVSTLRRNVNDLFMRNGQVEEAKLFAGVGKMACIWLIFKHTDSVLQTENTLITLLLFLIMPDLLKKWLSMRFGGTNQPTKKVGG